jgi:hypothetical protein
MALAPVPRSRCALITLKHHILIMRECVEQTINNDIHKLPIAEGKLATSFNRFSSWLPGASGGQTFGTVQQLPVRWITDL